MKLFSGCLFVFLSSDFVSQHNIIHLTKKNQNNPLPPLQKKKKNSQINKKSYRQFLLYLAYNGCEECTRQKKHYLRKLERYFVDREKKNHKTVGNI